MNTRRILSNTEILFLQAVGDNEVSGRQVREALAEQGKRKSAPSFYMLAAALEDERFIDGWYKERTITGQLAKERYYRLTAHGKQMLLSAITDEKRSQH